MAVEKWIAGSGQGLTYGSAGFSTEINSLVSGNAVIAASAINNATALDIFADVSVSLGSVTTGAGAPYIGLYLFPLNEDGSTYGPSGWASSAAGPMPSQYFVGAIPCGISATGVITGTISGIILPPGSFKFGLYNLSGATLASSANVVDYRSYNRAIA